jgi:hypothetical protein
LHRLENELKKHATHSSTGSTLYHLCILWLKRRSDRLHTDCITSTILKNQTGTHLYWLLLTVCYLGICSEILRYIWLSKIEPKLPFDGLKFHTDGFMFECRAGSEVFWRNLISRHYLSGCGLRHFFRILFEGV